MTHRRRIRALTITAALLICIPSVDCFGSWPHESLTLGIDEKKEDIEYEENPRIQMRHEDRIIEDTLTENGRYNNIDVIVYAFKETIILNLRLNRQLFASSYVEKIITESGVIYNAVNHVNNNCYYIGAVQNKSDSKAAVSTCEGINGYFTIGNFSYHIAAEARGNRLNGANGVYKMRHNLKPIYNNENGKINVSARFQFASKHRRQKRSFEWPQDVDGGTKVLELYIVNDFSQFAGNKNDTSAVFQRAKSVANSASSSYQSVGIYFVLVGMEVWTAADRFLINGSNSDATLEALNRYRMENIAHVCYNDHTVLLTKAGFDNRASGYANFAKICSNQNSSSIVVDNYSLAAATGSVMARQIGRSFGLIDDGQSCYCTDVDSWCIMSPVQSVKPATNWSWCSLQQFNHSFRTGLDICLYDSPQTIYEPTVSTCGNGIIENGEQCDCGRSIQSDCNSSCCDPITCRLTNASACASGRCCDKTRCQILAAGNLCRSSSSGCDLPEHCDGRVSTCPVDTYKPNGTPCTINGDSVFCYKGKCNSHRSQCELIWGKGTSSSSSICYLNYNTYGLHYGNCGLNWLPHITYIPCQKNDSKCGKLLCDTSVDRPLAFYQIFFSKSTSSINNLTCTSVIFDFGLRIQDPGLVPNGASCGDGQMCIDQRCVNVSSVQTSCLESCRGDEVCNNLGRCQNQSIQDQRDRSFPSSHSNYGQSSLTVLWSIVAIISHLLLTI